MKTFNYVSDMPVLEPLVVQEIDNKRFYISPNTGNKLPSVTTILGHFGKEGIQKWIDRVGVDAATKIKNRASTRGTKFHVMMEKYIGNDKTLFEGVMPDMKQAFRDAEKTLDKIDNIRYIEAQLWSEKLGTAGRTDVIGDYDGVLSVIDFKTSLREKKESYIQNYFEQGTAYAEMYEERVGEPIEQIVIIISVDGLDYPQVFIKNKKDHIENLMSKISAYKKEFFHVS